MGGDPAGPCPGFVDRRRDRGVGARLVLAELLSDRPPTLSALWGPIIGPIVSIVSFVCSIGNVPLAAVLWNGGISFGGVIAFIYADLLIIPILNIYRKYYGIKMMLTLLLTFYVSMVCAGYLVELLFGAAGLVPTQRNATVMQAGISWNYTTWLNIAFLILAAVLVARFIRTGGIPMLHMMGGSPDTGHDHHHHDHGHQDAGARLARHRAGGAPRARSRRWCGHRVGRPKPRRRSRGMSQEIVSKGWWR